MQFVHKIGSFTSNSNNVDDWPRMDLKIIRKKKEFRSSDEEISLSKTHPNKSPLFTAHWTSDKCQKGNKKLQTAKGRSGKFAIKILRFGQHYWKYSAWKKFDGWKFCAISDPTRWPLYSKPSIRRTLGRLKFPLMPQFISTFSLLTDITLIKSQWLEARVRVLNCFVFAWYSHKCRRNTAAAHENQFIFILRRRWSHTVPQEARSKSFSSNPIVLMFEAKKDHCSSLWFIRPPKLWCRVGEHEKIPGHQTRFRKVVEALQMAQIDRNALGIPVRI